MGLKTIIQNIKCYDVKFYNTAKYCYEYDFIFSNFSKMTVLYVARIKLTKIIKTIDSYNKCQIIIDIHLFIKSFNSIQIYSIHARVNFFHSLFSFHDLINSF